MPLEPGTRLGRYEVLSPLGGAADERYKASDSGANRLVSLKLLPAQFSTDPEHKLRLERDSRIISSLRHPNICTTLEVGHHDPSIDFVVAEYVEGETLAERLRRGPMPLREALAIAFAIADSLDKAHRQGVVHGGLTPSTILLTKEGPKVLDFGVAALKDESRLASTTSIAATRTSLPAFAQVSAAAAPYLSPEQLAGATADARTDIFAFGTILYEMAAGRPPFLEKTLALLIAAIHSVDPEPLSKFQPSAPPALDHLLRRCLEKDPKQRLQTAWDLMCELKWIIEGGSQIGISLPAAVGRTSRDRLTWITLGVLVLAGTAIAPFLFARFQRPVEAPVARFLAPELPVAVATPVTISPNGRWLAASPGGTVTLGVVGLPLNSTTAQTLIKGNVVTQPFWSADSRSIAFFENGILKKAEIAGGPSQNISEVASPIAGGSWNREGTILYSSANVIYRVAAAGGQPAPITALEASTSESAHLYPSFLPDGRHFLFLAVAPESAIYLASLDSKERTRLFAAESKAIYATPGYILFNRGNTLFAQPFDADKLAMTGEPIRVADNLSMQIVAAGVNPAVVRTALFAASGTGVLVFRTAGESTGAASPDEQRSLFWFDRDGVQSTLIGTPGMYEGIDLSPDGKRFAVHRHEGTGGDNWIFDVSQGRMQRLTFDAAQDNQSPVWSPDGLRIAYASRRNNKWGLYVKLADGTGADELITESETGKAPMSWSPDGKVLVYFQAGGTSDVWAVPVSGDKKPIAVLESSFNELHPQISADGKWIAYQSNETGRPEIYVRPFPEGPGKWQVSTAGGTFPRWRGDGRELYFIVPPNLMAADIRVVGSSLQPGVPRPLFSFGGNPSVVQQGHNSYLRYAVTADGKRFLASIPGGGGQTSGGLADQIAVLADRGGSTGSAAVNTVTVVVNWSQMLSKK